MAQLSRPYQIGLAAVAVLAAAWLLLLQGHGSSGSSSSGSGTAQVSPSRPHAPASSVNKAEGNAGTDTGHGSASSIGSLGRAVEKARGAATTSKQNEKKLNERSSQASNESTSTSAGRPAETTAPSRTTSTGALAAPAAPAPLKAAAPGAAHRSTSAVQQQKVEAQLAKGRVAVILFWDPKGADDRLVHRAVGSMRGNSSLKIAVDEASAKQVASFGSITRGVQVYGTPTLLFVNKQGKVLTLTGLQDSFAIAQAVREVRHA
ncbi:MAG TPA: hypothetical protein VF927_12140 [Solirubrobacteraceae bacterium]